MRRIESHELLSPARGCGIVRLTQAQSVLGNAAALPGGEKVIALFKALVPGVILTLIVCLLIGSSGSHGGFLNIFRIMIEGHAVYWSWQLFFASTGTAWGIISMMK